MVIWFFFLVVRSHTGTAPHHDLTDDAIFWHHRRILPGLCHCSHDATRGALCPYKKAALNSETDAISPDASILAVELAARGLWVALQCTPRQHISEQTAFILEPGADELAQADIRHEV